MTVLYAITDATGVVIGTGTAADDADGMASAAGFGAYHTLPLDSPVGPGWHFDGTAFQELPPSPGPWAVWTGAAWTDPRSEADHAAALEAARDAARRTVNHARGQVRLRYITDEPGQAMVYMDKEAAALAWLADPDPVPALYPAIYAEVGSTAPTAWEVAQVYVNMALIWRQISAVIEGVVMAAHAVLDTATDIETCEQVAAGIAGQIDAALIAAGVPT